MDFCVYTQFICTIKVLEIHYNTHQHAVYCFWTHLIVIPYIYKRYLIAIPFIHKRYLSKITVFYKQLYLKLLYAFILFTGFNYVVLLQCQHASFTDSTRENVMARLHRHFCGSTFKKNFLCIFSKTLFR